MTLLNWSLAEKIAGHISSRSPEPPAYEPHSMKEMFDQLTPKAEKLVAEATGLVSNTAMHTKSARTRVLSRKDWIDANIKTFSRMLSPLEERLEGKLNRVSRNLGGIQIGVLLGWMSARVLGQYDLLILEDEDPHDQDLVYYVGPNIAAMEWRYGFEPADFRLWIALHELTHRAQFTGIPWLKKHFLSLIEQTLENVDLDTEQIKKALANFKERRLKGENTSMAHLFSSDKQIEILSQIGGMMSLLEGHGEVMMDSAAQNQIKEVERFHRIMRHRRTQNKGLAGILQKLLGIETKLRQYEAGENFVHQLQKRGGSELLNKAWENPENLPSMEEIKHPDEWIERIEKIKISS